MADVKIDGQTYTDVDVLNLEDTDGNEVKFYNDKNLQIDYSKQVTGKPKINGVELDDEVKLTADDVGALSQDKLQDGVNLALAQAKESGEFKGEKGDKGDKGDAFTYEDFTDEQLKFLKGEGYILTENDKQEIARMAVQLFPIYEGEVESI